MPELRKPTPDELLLARSVEYNSAIIQMDEHPLVKDTVDGIWVEAWVFVSTKFLKDCL